jgi:hypothetical protein
VSGLVRQAGGSIWRWKSSSCAARNSEPESWSRRVLVAVLLCRGFRLRRPIFLQLDAVEPVQTLGGYEDAGPSEEQADGEEGKKKKKSKKKKKVRGYCVNSLQTIGTQKPQIVCGRQQGAAPSYNSHTIRSERKQL